MNGRGNDVMITLTLAALQVMYVNGCLWLMARFYGALPVAFLAGLVFLFVLPIAGGVVTMLVALRFIRSLEPDVGEPEQRMFMAHGVTAAALWLPLAASAALGIHEYAQLRVHGERDEVAPASIADARTAGFITLTQAAVDWSDPGVERSYSSTKDSSSGTYHYDIAFAIRDVRQPDARTPAWLCVSISRPSSAPDYASALAEYRAQVERSGVIAGLVVHDPHDRRDCGAAARQREGALEQPSSIEPVFLRHRPSADAAREVLERRVVILVAIVNALFVLLPLLLDVRRLSRPRFRGR